MALSVDRVDLVANELIVGFGGVQDAVSILGLIYGFKLATSAVCNFWKAVYGHLFSKLYPVTNFADKFGNWAVITRASNAVSQEFAKQIARRGLNIILLDHDLEALKTLSKEIEHDYNIETHILQLVDLNSLGNLESLIQNKSVGILVNNACYSDPPGYFTELSRKSINDMMNMNIIYATNIIYSILPCMLIAQRGVIINFASAASSKPLPLFQVFSASQAYNDYLTRCLQWEYRDTKLIFQYLDPFLIQSPQASAELPLILSSFSTSPDVYVRHALSTLTYSSRTSGHWLHGLIHGLYSLLPLPVSMHIIGYSLLYWRAYKV